MYQNIEQYLESRYYNTTQIYTDASKDSEGKTGIAAYIPDYKISIKKRTSDNLSIFAAEMTAINIALHWIEEVRPPKAVICSDSMSSLTSIQNGESSCRQDLLNEINNIIFAISQQGIPVLIQFVWVPAHKGVGGNEEADRLAKEATKEEEVQLSIPLSKSEVKVLIKHKVNKIWQAEWDKDKKGRHLYNIQKYISSCKYSHSNRQEEVWFTRLRIGHTWSK